MKKNILYLLFMMLFIFSCNKEDDNNLFERSADERKEDAINALKSSLVAPANGWRMKYRPTVETGSFNVLLDFDENNKVTIKTDLGSNDGEFYEQTVPYRIDSSLGLELIFETYSFFSFLFEQDQANFGAEYEFNYVNETPDGSLVFSSRSDNQIPTTIVLEQASPSDESLLGVPISKNLNLLADDFKKFSSSLKLSYTNRDLAVFFSLNEFTRTITFNYIGLKSDVLSGQVLNFTTPYIISGNSIILDDPLNTIISGKTINIKQINLNNDLSESNLDICETPLKITRLTGSLPETNESILLETTLTDPNGPSLASNTFYYTPIQYILNNGESLYREIQENISGAVEFHLYYGLKLNNGETLNGIGFVIQNPDNSITFALKEFTPTFNENNLIFSFKEGITLFGNTDVTVNEEKINEIITNLTQGDKSFVFRYSDTIYEMYNPCSNWNVVLFAGR